MRVRKPWTQWDETLSFHELPGAMGIYEIADKDQKTIYIGFAGGHSPFGLRGELIRIFSGDTTDKNWNWRHPHPDAIPKAMRDQARYYRYEVNHQYFGRWVEALTRYREDFESLPALHEEIDKDRIPRLGRYHWKSQGV